MRRPWSDFAEPWGHITGVGVHPKSKRGFLGMVVLLNLLKFSEDHSVPSEQKVEQKIIHRF